MTNGVPFWYDPRVVITAKQRVAATTTMHQGRHPLHTAIMIYGGRWTTGEARRRARESSGVERIVATQKLRQTPGRRHT